MPSFNHLLDDSASSPHRPQATPYDPVRLTPPYSVLLPISRVELVQSQGSQNPLRRVLQPPPQPTPAATSAPTSRTASPAGVAGLPQKPEGSYTNGAAGSKRGFEGASNGGREEYKRPRQQQQHEDVSVVASHYNARPNIDRYSRTRSPIIGLKNFNNWTKSVLIAKFGRREGSEGPRIKVLDLGCGKGGDLQKWHKAGTDEYVGLDLAAVSVEQARSRFEGLRGAKFKAEFFASDCFESPIETTLAPSLVVRPFDVVSMQFCLHYAFESEAKARMMLSNVTRFLKPGGVLIGTIPDSANLLSQLDAIPLPSPTSSTTSPPPTEDLTFGNSVYGIKFDSRHPPLDEQTQQPSLFGHRYTFFLQDAVEEVPEYVVYWEGFVELAAEYGLQLTFHEDFQRIFVEERQDPQFAELLTKMKVVDWQGETEMTMDQWEAATLYVGFAFTKQEETDRTGVPTDSLL
ncbi:mRNA capping enzyme-domain-containing protein [Leucosporidium creatinivorum]|uniref:mRNA cap guanine-N(7) methyltransferase n=1 Tax=Leucosporidium creatinivorum TaxID=106004 RepID=A0A1Y2F3Y8_9BASI|nr:mRNA capping enzyme-domain-containing protein [Leucosporidium creatinivorum]